MNSPDALPTAPAAAPVSADDLYLFAEGTHERAWRFMGAHARRVGEVDGVQFTLWAPNARSVAVVGDFNGWSDTAHPLERIGSSGLWSVFVPGAGAGALYKFALRAADGSALPHKADPWARAMEQPGRTASIVAPEGAYAWRDGEWMLTRWQRNRREAPISIYEVHLGSWRRHADDNRYLGYRELAEQLVPYVRDMGFTHLQLLPVSEHPFDGSWGYQPLGLFAPSSRFGSAEDFRHFVDCCHAAGLGLLLDWVPAHFPTDAHGLGRFDGTSLYEHEDPRKGFHPDWNTLVYNLGRHEVASFLTSNALYWLEEFHVDGLRVDAVASMLYLDYSRKSGEWIPNEHGGNANLEAVRFLREVNRRLYANHPDTMTVAEESTAWPGVSHPVHAGGLGFGFKWNMGWMHDTLRYLARDPAHRRHHHDELTFALMYAFSENFVLPLSHDEVVHGKRSLLGRMPGDDWQRFANLRLLYAYLWTHPGKKLLFMGGEFGQEREWNHDRGLDWHHLEDARHAGVQRLVRDLNTLYREQPALHALDCDGGGFEWIDCADAAHSVLLFRRRAGPDVAEAVVACNFTPVPRGGYRIGVSRAGAWRERLNTDAALYGGSGLGNAGGLRTEAVPAHGQAQSLLATLPPLAVVVFIDPTAGEAAHG